ncbi:MAG: DUF1501 domain-containing protein [Planctomycetota bacterium]|nr:DUF1501 domain-containing protein [Planctomycetota bacterium]
MTTHTSDEALQSGIDGGTPTRRAVLQACLVAAAGTVLGTPMRAQPSAPRRGKATSVIQIWMWGGPPHLDTFDPKPEAGGEYCGPLTTPIATNATGMRIGELLPLLARQADKYALIRSMAHGINGHETASYLVQTGRQSGDGIVHPCVGSVVSLFKGHAAGYRGLVPPYVVLTQPQGRFSEAGFLGSRHKPFATGGNPAQDPFVVEGVVAPGITADRQRARRELLHSLDTLGRAVGDDAELAALRQSEAAAYDLILGDAGKVFDLTQETPAVRDDYGRSAFGQSCLLARRLVEKGVPYVTINYQGWDTHKEHFQAMRRKLPEMDRGMAALLADLAARGLLDSTIVWWGGEFGRTPKVSWEAPWNGGRGHHGRVFSTLVAGGGFRGGIVLGASDRRGEEVRDRAVGPTELIRSIYHLLGIDSSAKLPHPQGLDMRVLPELAKGDGGGLLREIL